MDILSLSDSSLLTISVGEIKQIIKEKTIKEEELAKHQQDLYNKYFRRWLACSNLLREHNIEIPEDKIPEKPIDYSKIPLETRKEFLETEIVKIFDTRIINVLLRYDITFIKDLILYSPYELSKFRDLGKKSFHTIADKLNSKGLKLGMTKEEVDDYIRK